MRVHGLRISASTSARQSRVMAATCTALLGEIASNHMHDAAGVSDTWTPCLTLCGVSCVGLWVWRARDAKAQKGEARTEPRTRPRPDHWRRGRVSESHASVVHLAVVLAAFTFLVRFFVFSIMHKFH